MDGVDNVPVELCQFMFDQFQFRFLCAARDERLVNGDIINEKAYRMCP